MLEVIVEDLSDALAAEAGGATQLDLKCDFLQGGLTPSAGMIEHVCANVGIDVLVMIRPHARTMVYSKSDIAVMCADIRLARKLGAKGFILGCITEDRHIDVDAVRAFKDAAGDCSINFHLAWELTVDLSQALETLIELGVQSVRTTGGAGLTGKAEEGIARIRAFAEQAAGRIDIVPAGGINAENVARIVAGTGLTNVHVGTGVRVPPTRTGVVDQHKVREVREVLDRAIASLHRSR